MSREGNKRYRKGTNSPATTQKYGSHSPSFHGQHHGSESLNWREPSHAASPPSHKPHVSSAHLAYVNFLTKGWNEFEKVKKSPEMSSTVKVISEQKSVSDEPVVNMDQLLQNKERRST